MAMRSIVQFRMPAAVAVDIQPVVFRIHVVVRTEPVQLPPDTVEVVMDTVLVAGILQVL